MILYDPQTREEWLKCRCRGIGGSDAGAVLGVNKYKTNVDLWAEKTHKKPHPEIKNNSAVEYGKNAEKLIRELYKLDYPENTVEYHEYRMYANDEHNFIYATLDGEIVRPDGTKGILEIKTCTIQNPGQWKEWENRIPDSYYAQILHQLSATGWDFAILRAYIRYFKGGELKTIIRDYEIARSAVTDDIETLTAKEIAFWKHVEDKTEPALILPEI